MALLRRLPEPAERRGPVLRHAGAVEQHLAIDRLRLGQAGLGPFANQRRPLSGEPERRAAISSLDN
jgi:uncharacterized protein YigA (DUF484 family)